MITIPPVDIVTVYQTGSHTGSLDALLHCTTKVQAVIVSSEMFILVTPPGGPFSKQKRFQIIQYILIKHAYFYVHTVSMHKYEWHSRLYAYVYLYMQIR